jgi:nucleotide-binding universal stress UspA family protein
MFERLLVTTDLSEASENMLKCLGPLRRVGAREATLLHVMDVRDVGGLYISLLKLIDPRLAHLRAVMSEQGFETRVETPLGKPSREINRFAAAGGYSVIVAGTHGESLAKDVLLGSVVHGLLQEARKPVLLIPFNVLGKTEEERCQVLCGDFFRHVLFATDFSETADRAFSYLRHIVESTKAQTTLYHAQDKARIEPHLKDKLEEFNRVDMERLERLEKDLAAAGAQKVHRVIEYGRPAKLLVDKANSGAFSLLVMGNQGRGYLAEAFLGRVAHHLVHHAAIPVLLVPMAA